MKPWVKAICAVQLVGLLLFVYTHHRVLQSSTHSTDLRQRGPAKAQPRSVQVPSKQDGVRRNAEAAERGGVTDHRPEETILIALASYGDMECAPTVARAFQRAAYPDRVFFGIFQQHNCTGLDDAAQCKDCTADLHDHLKCPDHPLCTRLWQVRVSRLPMKQTRGVTFGRFMAEKHYRDETYVMNIDSHSHFSRGWDSEIIDMFHRIGDDYALITTYPAHYSGSQMGHDHEDSFRIDRGGSDMCICQTARQQIFKTYNFKHVMGHIRRPDKPVRTAFLAAGFNFGRGHRVSRVPYDPHTPFLFDGEETSFGVRAWTHGYDFYHPDKAVVAHLYIHSGSALRPVFWTDDWGVRYKIQYSSTLRINYFLGLHDVYDPTVPTSEIDLQESDQYTVGKVRTVEQYWKWAKVNVPLSSPKLSTSLCRTYEAGGMPKVHRPGIDP